MIWFACALLVMVAGAYVLRPLFHFRDAERTAVASEETELDRLLERKQTIYRNIRELGFEHAMGRLAEDDYRELEAEYKNEAALILQELDRLGYSQALESAIERDIAAKKAALSDMQVGAVPLRCPACGAETLKGKRYCADCGRRL